MKQYKLDEFGRHLKFALHSTVEASDVIRTIGNRVDLPSVNPHIAAAAERLNEAKRNLEDARRGLLGEQASS